MGVRWGAGRMELPPGVWALREGCGKLPWLAGANRPSRIGLVCHAKGIAELRAQWMERRGEADLCGSSRWTSGSGGEP